MKSILYITLILAVFAFSIIGQKLEKPIKPTVKPTAAQQKTINEGIALHDAKRYDEAIVKYQSVLDECPDCTGAMYELSYSLAARGDRERSMEIATKGAKYISDELPLFYVLIANTLDDLGKSQEAVKIYLTGLKFLEGDTKFGRYRSSLYFNLGVTYLKQKNYADARSVLKSSVESDYNYASPNYLLSVLFNNSKYRIPAFLAAARFISIEFNTNRSATSARVIADVLKPAQKDPKTGNINIFLDINAPKDEGDFGIFDILLGTLTTVKDEKDKNKTDEEMFVDAIGTVINLLAEDKKLPKTFVGKNYVPFMLEMKNKGYVEPFGYLVLYRNGNEIAKRWTQVNEDKMTAFLKWAKEYELPSN